MESLDDIGRDIDLIDSLLVRLWELRRERAQKAGAAKRTAGLPIRRREVEVARISHAVALAEMNGIPSGPVREVMKLIIADCLAVQDPPPPIRSGWDGCT